MGDTHRELLTLRETAKLTGISYSRIWRLVKLGVLPAFRAGGRFYVKRAVFERWLRDGDENHGRSPADGGES